MCVKLQTIGAPDEGMMGEEERHEYGLLAEGQSVEKDKDGDNGGQGGLRRKNSISTQPWYR